MAKRRSSGACNWRRYALAGLVLVQIGLVLGLVGLEALPSPSGSLCQTPLQSEGYVVMERQLERLHFDVSAQCTLGYLGQAEVIPCRWPSTHYILRGCYKPGVDRKEPSLSAPAPPPPPPPPPVELPPPGEGHPEDANAPWAPHRAPVELELQLSESILSQRALQDHGAMFHQYGFNLAKSNSMALVRKAKDLRNPECQARTFPPLHDLPKVSVIIIFFNEPLSSLLRNVLQVLNLSPPELVGEVLLIDDHSDLEELSLLPEHLDRLRLRLPPGKIRIVRRETHDGIVGARNRGVKEARYPIIVILDSHVEVTPGWLEPLVARIHEDRKRVIVPNIVAINIETLEIQGGLPWPPIRGIFNWRLTFIGAAADPELDLLEKDVDKKASAIQTPVMPGGLFAMNRDYFFELGGYDPEIRYYGAEHVEMSFRIWMCGGSMEVAPCSNVGHIYREFDRFGVDRQLRHVDVGRILDRNDARVAEVWMDDYKSLFFRYRHMDADKPDLGEHLEERKELRKKLQCKSFDWFLDEVGRDLYVPDQDTESGNLFAVHTSTCIAGEQDDHGPVKLKECDFQQESQKLEFTSRSYLQISGHVNHHLVCLRTQLMSQVPCEKGARWRLEDGKIASLDRAGECLARSPSGEEVDLLKCKDAHRMQWRFEGKGTLSGPDGDLCVDNMQRSSGPPGLYGCHGGLTQQWQLDGEDKLRSGQGVFGDGICLGFEPSIMLAPCASGDEAFAWIRRASMEEGRLGMQTFSPRQAPDKCLAPGEGQAALQDCEEPSRFWKFPFQGTS